MYPTDSNVVQIIQNILENGIGPLSLSLVDTTPTPDTILLVFETMADPTIMTEWESFAFLVIDLGVMEAWYNQPAGLINLSLVDTTPTPDTILLEFESFDQSNIPMYPKPTALSPVTNVFAGDLGAYIG